MFENVCYDNTNVELLFFWEMIRWHHNLMSNTVFVGFYVYLWNPCKLYNIKSKRDRDRHIWCHIRRMFFDVQITQLNSFFSSWCITWKCRFYLLLLVQSSVIRLLLSRMFFLIYLCLYDPGVKLSLHIQGRTTSFIAMGSLVCIRTSECSFNYMVIQLLLQLFLNLI